MDLHYRGQQFEKAVQPVAYRRSYAVNWRYQVPGEPAIDAPIPAMPASYPRAMNWRYQVDKNF